MKKILIMSIVLVSVITACSSAGEAVLVEPQAAVEEENELDESSTVILDKPAKQGNDNGERQFPGFDYEAIAISLGVSADDLAFAIEENRSQGGIDVESAAAQLGIEADVLLAALESVDSGMGKGPGNMLPVEIDYATAAEQLNVSEADLRAALDDAIDDNGRPNFEQAAQQLGLDVNELMGAVDMGGRGKGGPGNK
jgi:hypothetical protein